MLALDVLPRLLKKLHAAKILVADLGGGDGDDLETKYMGLCRRSARDKVRRIGESRYSPTGYLIDRE